MSVNAANLILGPARLYVGAFGATEPLDSTATPNGTTTPPSSSAWTDVGGTDGGVSFEIDNTYTDLNVDQIIMPVGSRLTGMAMMVTTQMSEITLTNLNTAMNNIATTGSGSGYTTMDVPVGSAATQPTYAALCIDAWAPQLSSGAAALGRIIVRKVLSQVKVAMMYDRKTQGHLDVTFNAYFVSNSIAPCHLIYQTA